MSEGFGEGGPFRVVKHKGKQVQIPRSGQTIAVAVDVMGDTVLANDSPGLIGPGEDFGSAEIVHDVDEGSPAWPEGTVRFEHFVHRGEVWMIGFGQSAQAIDVGFGGVGGHDDVNTIWGIVRGIGISVRSLSIIGTRRWWMSAPEYYCRLKSRVNGNSALIGNSATRRGPGLWPKSEKRAIRRLSAS